MDTSGGPPLPLAGFRVLDLTRFLAGPYAAMVLADLGADVIKVEPPGGDDSRNFGPFHESGESWSFIQANRGKRSVALDLKDARGRALALKLALRTLWPLALLVPITIVLVLLVVARGLAPIGWLSR